MTTVELRIRFGNEPYPMDDPERRVVLGLHELIHIPADELADKARSSDLRLERRTPWTGLAGYDTSD